MKAEDGVIRKIVGVKYAQDKSYANVFVQLMSGDEIYEVYIGGTVKIWEDREYNKLKAWVKPKA